MNLGELRERANLTQQELAELLEVNRVTIVRYERGEREPSIQTIIQIATHLCITTDEVIRALLEAKKEEPQ